MCVGHEAGTPVLLAMLLVRGGSVYKPTGRMHVCVQKWMRFSTEDHFITHQRQMDCFFICTKIWAVRGHPTLGVPAGSLFCCSPVRWADSLHVAHANRSTGPSRLIAEELRSWFTLFRSHTDAPGRSYETVVGVSS